MERIDLGAALQQSDSKLLKKLPGFVVALLRRLICERKMNTLLAAYGHLDAPSFRQSLMRDCGISFTAEGLDKLPDSPRALFVCNHPFGILDGMILTHIVQEKYGDFRSIGNDAWKFIPPLLPHIITVNVYGKSSREELQVLEDTLAGDLPITHFPAGEVGRVYEGKIQDASWHKSLVAMARRHGRAIVPFYMQGQNSDLFYTIFRLRRALGIDLNLELALLPSEFFKKRGASIKVLVRPPVWPEELESTQSDTALTKIIRHYTLTGERPTFLNNNDFNPN